MSINLLPWRENRYKARKKYFFIELVVSFLFCLLFICFYEFNSEYTLKNKKKEIKNMEIKIKEMSDSYGSIFALKKQSAEDAKKEEFLNSKENDNQVLFELVDDISRQVFDSIYLTEIKRNEDGVKFSGRSISHVELAKFLERIKVKIKKQPILTRTAQAKDGSGEVVFDVVYDAF